MGIKAVIQNTVHQFHTPDDDDQYTNRPQSDNPVVKQFSHELIRPLIHVPGLVDNPNYVTPSDKVPHRKPPDRALD